MSNQPQGLRTPHRFNMFDEEEEQLNHNNVFTPCTRLSRMTIESQTNGSSRFRKPQFNLPSMNFTERLLEASCEQEEQEQISTPSSSTHKNLEMFLGSDRISMFDKSKDQLFSFSEDEDSDEGDLFSSTLYPMSSPERQLTRQSIFDDEPMNSPPNDLTLLNRNSIFDQSDYQEENDEQQDYYDPSDLWLSQIYTDDSNNNNESIYIQQQQQQHLQEEENKPPCSSLVNKETKLRRTLPLEEDNLAHERLPLREIRFEDYPSDDGLPAKKKSLLSSGKPHKMRYMRSLSPPRYAKRKGKEPAENIMPLSSVL